MPSSDSGWHVLLHHTGAGGWRGDHLDIVMDDGSFVRSHHTTASHYAAKKELQKINPGRSFSVIVKSSPMVRLQL